MPNSPLSKVCVCGSGVWHMMADGVTWCRRCGSLRLLTERYWRVPFDRAGDLSSTVVLVDGEEEPITIPDTPATKKD